MKMVSWAANFREKWCELKAFGYACLDSIRRRFVQKRVISVKSLSDAEPRVITLVGQ